MRKTAALTLEPKGWQPSIMCIRDRGRERKECAKNEKSNEQMLQKVVRRRQTLERENIDERMRLKPGD